MSISTANYCLSLQPSKVLMLILSFLHLLAIVTMLVLAMPLLIKVIIILLIIVLGFITINKFALIRDDSSIIKLNCVDKGNSKLMLKNGIEIQANLISAKWLFEYFAVLVFKNNTKSYKTIIAKDALSQEQFYTLRLYLRSLNTLR
ncbi:MAG: protein YgfX [Pseudomonadota bacterium]